jgi:GntR family transcriptional repressor for pyruvate dehydrogenase complex
MKRGARASGQGSPEHIADVLMARIFRGELAAGTKLPAERQLAVDLGVDRTTLRMAMKQLQRMNLVAVRHGSGVEVRDYRVHGGLDVLAAMFAQDDLSLEGSFLVEALDFWVDSFAMTAAKAIARMSLEDMRGLEATLDRAIAAGDDADALTEAQIETQEALARLSGSVMFRMLSNSTRSLRRRMTRLLCDTVDVPASLRTMKEMLRAAALSRPTEDTVKDALLAALRQQSAGLRERLLLAPKSLAKGGKRRRRDPGRG